MDPFNAVIRKAAGSGEARASRQDSQTQSDQPVTDKPSIKNCSVTLPAARRVSPKVAHIASPSSMALPQLHERLSQNERRSPIPTRWPKSELPLQDGEVQGRLLSCSLRRIHRGPALHHRVRPIRRPWPRHSSPPRLFTRLLLKKPTATQYADARCMPATVSSFIVAGSCREPNSGGLCQTNEALTCKLGRFVARGVEYRPCVARFQNG